LRVFIGSEPTGARSFVLGTFSLVAILSLYELAISRGFTVAVRLTPMLDGYTVRIQVGSYQGPCPRFEKHFTPEMPVADAVDAMAKYPLDFFTMGRGGVSVGRGP
jgi:hypothetical protein